MRFQKSLTQTQADGSATSTTGYIYLEDALAAVDAIFMLAFFKPILAQWHPSHDRAKKRSPIEVYELYLQRSLFGFSVCSYPRGKIYRQRRRFGSRRMSFLSG
jgi:hypothetical protein